MNPLAGLSDEEIRQMDVRELLDRFRRMPRETGPVTLSDAYLRRIDRQEASPANAPGADKSWVSRSIEEFDRTMKQAVLLPRP